MKVLIICRSSDYLTDSEMIEYYQYSLPKLKIT